MSPLPVGDVLPTLADLVSKSIVTRADDEVDDEPRYRMLNTVRAYALERLAEANEEEPTRDAAARYYLEFTETADPLLRAKTQAYWFRALTAEQDNVNAAFRWSIARGDTATALRFIRSLGYYWNQRGHGEAPAPCREVLAMPVPPLTLQLAEGRVMCALLAAGWTWNFDLIREPLEESIAALKSFGSDSDTIHPMAAMAEPVLLQYDGDADAAQKYFEQYRNSGDPWLRATSKVFNASYAQSLGQLDGAEQFCREGLAELRAMGEQWGVAMAQTQLVEFTEMRADHAASIEAITEAATIGRELGVWGDITYVEGRLAVIHARLGDLDRGYAEMAQVHRSIEARGGQVDTDRWVMLMSAELASLKGDYAEAARCCEAVLATVASHPVRWWESLRAIVKARLAIAVLSQGDERRCKALLTESVDAAANWVEHPTLAAVLDACAVYAQTRADNPDPELSARLLGAAAGIRGAFDESSLDAPRARESAIADLGEDRFKAAYDSAFTSTYESAAALARSALPR